MPLKPRKSGWNEILYGWFSLIKSIIGVARMKTVPFSSDSAFDTVAYTLVKKQIVGVASRSGRINKSQCSFPGIVIIR